MHPTFPSHVVENALRYAKERQADYMRFYALEECVAYQPDAKPLQEPPPIYTAGQVLAIQYERLEHELKGKRLSFEEGVRWERNRVVSIFLRVSPFPLDYIKRLLSPEGE